MDEEKNVLICARAEWSSGQRIPGASKAVCSVCTSEVWVAPSGRKMIEADTVIVVCSPCGMFAIAEAGDEAEIAEITPEQQAEISKALRQPPIP